MSAQGPDLPARARRLAARLGDIDGMLLGDHANVRWLTGVAGEGHVLYGNTPLWAAVGPGGDVRLVAPACELGWLRELVDLDAVEPYGRFVFDGAAVPQQRAVRHTRPLGVALAAALDAVGAGPRLGVDDGAPPSVLSSLSASLPERELRPAPDVMLAARRIKDRFELDCLRAANGIAERAILATVEQALPGAVERNLLAELRKAMVDEGARPMLGSVGISERGALVDTTPSDRVLRRGDVIRFDVGCTVGGYHADLARTVTIGEPEGWVADAYAALLAGEEAALEAVRPGIRGEQLFDVAVGAARAAGLADYDRSHCGHGIGLNIYEPPLLAPGSDLRLEAGMTLCLETPLYVLGAAGLQVEDAIVVTDEGAERLGEAARELIVTA